MAAFLAGAMQGAGAAASTAGSAIGSAAGSVGSALGSAGSAIESGAGSALNALSQFGQPAAQAPGFVGPAAPNVGGMAGLANFGRGYLGFSPVGGYSPGFNAPTAGYGLGTLAQGMGGAGGQQQMNPQQIMGILRQLVPQQQMGPATRILPSGPGAATPHGLLAQIGMGI